MGFSVSGSAAVVFAGMLIAFGMFHAAASDGFERVSDARHDSAEQDLARENTAIDIDYVDDTGALTVAVDNTGATHLSLRETDVLVDNEYQTGWRSGADVGDSSDSFLWLPGETLTFDLGDLDNPQQVKVVTEHGVADTREV